MDDLLKFALEKGGIVALLIIFVIVLWHQLTKDRVSTKDFMDRLIKNDDQRQEQILLLVKQMYELQKNTQETLIDMRRTQELMLLRNVSSIDPEILEILKKLDKSQLKVLVNQINSEG